MSTPIRGPQSPSRSPDPAAPGATPTSSSQSRAVDPTARAGTATPTPRLGDTVEAGGAASLAATPVLAQGGTAVSAELLAELRSLLTGTVDRASAAALGDVDAEANPSAGAGWLTALGAAPRLREVFAGDDSQLQGKVAFALAAVSSGIHSSQRQAGFSKKGSLVPVLEWLKNGPHDTLPQRAAAGLSQYSAGLPKNVDINAFVQWVLREAYLDVNEDLRMYAEKVKFFNDMKKHIREQLTLAREAMAKLAGKDDTHKLNPPLIAEPINGDFTGRGAWTSTGAGLHAAEQTKAPTKSKLMKDKDFYALYGKYLAQNIYNPGKAYELAKKEFEAEAKKRGQATLDVNNGEVEGSYRREGKDGTREAADDIYEDARKELDSMVGKLTPEEMAALEWYLETTGMEISIKIKDGAGNELEYEKKLKKEPGESMEEYLIRAAGVASYGATGELSKEAEKDWGERKKQVTEHTGRNSGEAVGAAIGGVLAIGPATMGAIAFVPLGAAIAAGSMALGGAIGGAVGEAIADHIPGADDLMSHTDAFITDVKEGLGDFLEEIPLIGDLVSEHADRIEFDIDFRLPLFAYDPSAVIDSNAGGTTGRSPGSTVLNTKGDLEAHIKSLEEQLSSAGDDAQLANVDLQNVLQKQQQLLQMMSNISKMLHDTALAVIRKLGG